MRPSASQKISFSNILNDIDLYVAQKSETFFQKIPDCLKREFLGIPYGLILTLFITAIAIQLRCWGDHFPFFDQEYYLFGGEQILRGKIPYVDFWDCKPVGLFLLYALISLFDPYQYYALPIISSLFLFIGALGFYKIARFFAGKTSSSLMSFLFVLINACSRTIRDGQSEQFFIPLVVWGIALIFIHWDHLQHSLKKLFLTGCASMLLFGTAIEIKPSCLFEGILTGIFLLSLILLNHSFRLKKRIFYCILFGSLWIFIALLPTLFIITWYAEHHYLNDWIFANLQSNAKREKWLSFYEYTKNRSHRFILNGFILLLIGFIGFFYLKHERKVNNSSKFLRPYLFIFLWMCTAFSTGTILRSGETSFHYILPTTAPFLLIAIFLWRKVILLKFCLFILFVFSSALLIAFYIKPLNHSTQLYIQSLLMQQSGCLFAFGEPNELYASATPASSRCLPTKYMFPETLPNPQYRFALPINPETELRDVLAKRPLYLILPRAPNPNECLRRNADCIAPDKDLLWSRKILPEREWQLLENTLQDYTPLYLKENEWGLYKLKAGLTPGIVPSGIKAIPSTAATITFLKIHDKHLEALEKTVNQWPSG